MLIVTGPELRVLTNKGIKTIQRLIKDEEWEVAAHMMGNVLEYSLKAASCKALNLKGYPPVRAKGGTGYGFSTHDFEQLLIVSGLNDLFGSLSTTKAFNNWSEFTINYPGEWTEMRYKDMSKKFDKAAVLKLADNLYNDSDSIIETIKKHKRW